MKKNFTYFLTLVLAYNLSLQTLAFGSSGELVDIEPTSIFVPVGFDDNDDVVAVIDGYLPDTCYRLRTPEIVPDAFKKTLRIQPKAVRFPGPCMDVTIPYTSVVHLGSVKYGDYTVTTNKGVIKENLLVKQSTKHQPDDYLYAPVETAQIEVLAVNQLRAILQGRFTNSCLRMDEVKVTVHGKTIEVLPIMKQLSHTETGEVCKKIEAPFEEKFLLPELKPGRYLLHVRTLNGHSVNHVFTQDE